MDGREASHDTIEAFVAARTASSALDAKAVSLADDVKVRKMSDAPGRPPGGAASKAARSNGWSMLASAKPQTSAAIAR